jgi:hypothetical protein
VLVSETLAYYRLEVVITKNRLVNNMKEGMELRNVGLISLGISENDFNKNYGSGCRM